MIRRTALALLTLLLVSCATPPPPPAPVPSFTLATGRKVGVLVALNSTMVHEHIGTTVFNNFSADMKLAWDLPKRAKEAFLAGLTSSGFEAVDLSSQGFTEHEINGLIGASLKSWDPNPGRDAALSRMKDELGLSAVVVMSGVPTLANLECTGGGCMERYIRAPGLFTRSILGITRYHAVAALETKVFVLPSGLELNRFDPIVKVAADKVKVVDMSEPRNFKNLTDEEFKPAADWIGSYVDRIAAASVTALRAGGP